MKKRLISLLMTAAMIMTFLPVTVSAQASINIGEYVQMGTYYGEPILWRCVDIDENGPLMLSDKIICIKPFDAAGDNTSGSHGRGYNDGYYRKQFGSDYWADSNIRCWLNSDASAGNVNWACQNPPSKDKVDEGYNAYDKEAGFLTNFTSGERNAIKTVTQKSLLNGYEHDSKNIDKNYHIYDLDIDEVVQNYDTALSEQVTDSVFLLDVKQVNSVYNNSNILGDRYYVGEPTEQCVANSEYKDSSLKYGNKWYYWLRSPDSHRESSLVLPVSYGGDVGSYYAHDTYVGVRPAFYLNLSSSSFTSGKGTSAAPYTVEGSGVTKPEDASITLTSLNISGYPIGESKLITVNVYNSGYDSVSISVNNSDVAELAQNEVKLKEEKDLKGNPYKKGDIYLRGKSEGIVILTAALPDGTSKSTEIKVTKPEQRGFDATRDGWAFVNTASSFGYRECNESSHNHEQGKTYYEAIAMNSWIDVFGTAIMPLQEGLINLHWGGNCYGMSSYSAAIYNGFENWNDSNEVNDSLKLKSSDNGKQYTASPSKTITNTIERAQISQYSREASINKTSLKGTNKQIFKQVVDDIINEKKTYIVCAMYTDGDTDGGHAMVTDTARGVEDSGNGWYKIYLYDPNYPHYEDYKSHDMYFNDSHKYWNMRWLNVNVNTGEWHMGIGTYKNGEEKRAGSSLEGSKLYFQDPICHQGHHGFKGYTIDSDNALFASGMDITLTDSDGDRLFEVENGQVTYSSGDIEVYHDMTAAMDAENTVFSGKISLKNADLGKALIGNAAFTLIKNKKVTQVKTDDNAECKMNGNEVLVKAKENADVKLVSENMNSRDKYDAVTIEGTLENNKTITVNNKDNENYDITSDSKNKFDVTVQTQDGSEKLDSVDLKDWNNGGESNTNVKDTDTNKTETDFGSAVSTWAKQEVEEAYSENLIPKILVGKDLTKKVDRAEFAAISVKLYEELSNKKSTAGKNPFNDINTNECKEDILKAYNLGITNGISETKFAPSALISREQVATMLTRAYKKSEFPNWTLAKDGDYPLNYMGVTKYADDKDISPWAKESVYFMTRWNILNGVDGTHFAPKNSTTLGESYGYATREQAVVIALRSSKHLK